MKMPVFAYAALIAVLTLPVLLLAAADRQAVPSQTSTQLVADPGLKIVTERSAYMRTER